MECKHPRIKSVNCVLFCCECGAILPHETLTAGEHKAPEENAQEAPKKPRKRAKKEGQP